ncbi:MAG: D-Ala-D-Ala carboxypeptidase family metallohydrolase [Pseudomonadota bacterium]
MSRRNVATVMVVAALSGCTSTVGTLDTALLQINTQQSGPTPPATIPTPQSAAIPGERPPQSLEAQTIASVAQTEPTALASLAPAPVKEAEPVAIAAIQPQSDETIAQATTTFPQPPAPTDTGVVPDENLADLRIAQANAATTGSDAGTTIQPVQPTAIVSAGTQATAPNRSGLLGRLFSRNDPEPPLAIAAAAPAADAAPSVPSTVPTAAPAPQPTIAVRSASATPLPGVDRDRLFGINQSPPPETQVETRPVQVASAAGLARLAPNGLRTQHSGVDVACLKPALVRVLKRVERHFGKPVVVTSGYRSPKRNSNARGAKNSLHIYCAAADIQIEGVSKWDLASYMRSMPGRGGVGTYCHTKSVHVDIGPKRDWNWRCRRG